MSVNDAAVLVGAVGYVYTADVDTAAPLHGELATLDPELSSGWTATGWTSVGHTSRGDLPEFGYEGGNTEIRGSWQNQQLREVTTDIEADYLTVYLHQFDENALGLYYGEDGGSTEGEFEVYGGIDTVAEKATLVVIIDGDFRLGFYAPKASIRREEAVQLSIDDLGALPIRASFLKSGSLPLYKWINGTLFNPA